MAGSNSGHPLLNGVVSISTQAQQEAARAPEELESVKGELAAAEEALVAAEEALAASEAADATAAVDSLDVDYNEQAAKAAENYLEFTGFSRSGLIEQLVFEGYMQEQATYGVDQTGL